MGEHLGKWFKRIRRFSDADKQDIARRYAAGELLKNIAYIHRTTPSTVSDIGRRLSGVSRREWKMNPDNSCIEQTLQDVSGPINPIPWPDPTLEMLASPEFKAIWQCIKDWDIHVPDAYSGYMEATGNHVRAILDALRMASVQSS